MTLDQIPAVVMSLQDCYYCKFVVAELTDESGATKIVVRADNHEGHHHLYMDLRTELYDTEIQFKCLGGGMIWYDHELKKLVIMGQSFDYGAEPDRHQTQQMIQVAYPDFHVFSQ